ncbi:MAG: hypothetical protein ACR2J3_00440 [Aridibacter sp.]
MLRTFIFSVRFIGLLSEAIFSHVIYGVGQERRIIKGRFNVLQKGLSNS